MAINSRSKRQSVAGLRSRPIMLPGLVDAGDRKQVSGIYRGIAGGSGTPPVTGGVEEFIFAGYMSNVGLSDGPFILIGG